MPTRLIQSDAQAPGEATFLVQGPAVKSISAPEAIALAIVQPGPTELYLEPNHPDDPWTPAVARFLPIAPRLQDGALQLDVDIGVLFHLQANKPYMLHIQQEGGPTLQEVFTVPPALRRPTRLPEGWKPPARPGGPLTASPPEVIAASPDPVVQPPDPAPEPEPLRPAPGEDAQERQSEKTGPAPVTPVSHASSSGSGGRKTAWIGLAAVALLALGAGAFFLWPDVSEPQQDVQAQAPAPDMTLDAVRSLLAATPSAAEARAQADALAAQGKLQDGQFLLYKYAAEKGDAQSARVMGEFYDPNTWAQDKSPMPAPNVEQAEFWLKQAAEAGDAQAQYRYGMLLKQGRTEAQDGPERAVAWLRKAAQQGHEQAAAQLNP